MTRIDFYILEQAGDDPRERFACRLAEKAYKMGNRVYIHTGSEQQCQRLDQLLWTFRDGSFVPHETHPADAPETPVILGLHDAPEDTVDVLINLDDKIPEFFSRFERVAEVVDGDTQRKQDARERFKFYRERGYELQTHNL